MKDIHGNERTGSYSGATPFTPAGKHPAKYNDALIPVIAAAISDKARVLDPMAGTGKLALVKRHGFAGKVYCNDIEDWGEARHQYDPLVDGWTFCDAASLPYPDGFFDAIATSPTYGNGINQNRPAVPWYRVVTYRGYLGRDLSPGNTGCRKWGKTYRTMHERIYSGLMRVLAPEGVFVLNMADFILSGTNVAVTDWHVSALSGVGLERVESLAIPCRKMRCGSNGERRIGHENIVVFRKTSA